MFLLELYSEIMDAMDLQTTGGEELHAMKFCLTGKWGKGIVSRGGIG